MNEFVSMLLYEAGFAKKIELLLLHSYSYTSHSKTFERCCRFKVAYIEPCIGRIDLFLAVTVKEKSKVNMIELLVLIYTALYSKI